MASQWDIVVKGHNQASPVFRQVANDAGTTNKHLESIGRAARALGRATEVDGFAKGTLKAAGAAGEFAGYVGMADTALGFLGPTAALGTASILGLGVVVAAGAQRLFAFAEGWAKTAVGVQDAADRIGMSAQDLQRFQSGAAYSSVSADAMAASLEGLQRTLYGAKWGTNVEAIAAMRELGIQLHYAKDGSIDVKRGMFDVADAMARFKGNAGAQAHIGKIFGITPEAMAALRDGSADLQAQMDRAAANGDRPFSKEQLENAKNFTRAMRDFHNEWSRTKQDIGMGLQPFLTGQLDMLTDFLKHPLTMRAGSPVDRLLHHLPGNLGSPRPAPPSRPPIVTGAMMRDFISPHAAPRGSQDFASRIEHLGEHSRQNQVSSAGATGVMQLLEPTARRVARQMGIQFDAARFRSDPAYNRMLGAFEADRLLKKYGGDETLAAAAYNAGEGRLDGPYKDSRGHWQTGWLARFGDPRKGQISDADFAAMIPFKETQDYVRRVARMGGAGGQVVVTFANAPRGMKAAASGPGLSVRVDHAMVPGQ